jgi:beta-fructofuranosidase
VAHFTPRRGWVNDPYGVRWDGTRYHMCYQAVPDRTAWSPQCVWGHAVSDDLVSWEQRAVALTPQAHEDGCWSGCVVDDAAGVPRLFYTSVRLDDLEIGSIAMARYIGSERWASTPEDVVVAGPPEDLAVTAFRDPYVWRDATGWTMIVGCGLADGTGAVLQYRSRDLDRWRCTGVLCAGRVGADPGGGREVWECPQMVQVDDVWVLAASVQDAGRIGPVVAATGSYDGDRFDPEGWRRLAFGTAPYATSLFRDRDGRVGMISWLREDPQHECASGWAGAHSLVAELAIDSAGRLAAAPHSGLAASGAFANHAPVIWPWVHDLAGGAPARAVHVTAAAEAPVAIDLRHNHEPLARIGRSPAGDGLVVCRPGQEVDFIPCPHPSATIELFVDTDILEIFSGGAYGAWRLRPAVGPETVVFPESRGARSRRQTRGQA